MNLKHIKSFHLFENFEMSEKDRNDGWSGGNTQILTKWVDNKNDLILTKFRYNDHIHVTRFKDNIIVDNMKFNFQWKIEFTSWHPKIILEIDIEDFGKYNIESIYIAFVKAFNETSINLYNIQKSNNFDFKELGFSNEIGIDFSNIHRNTDDYNFILEKLYYDNKTYEVCNKFRHNHIYVFFEENIPFKLDGVKVIKKKTIDNINFNIFSDLKDYCLVEACGTFAYTLSSYFDDILIFAIGEYTKKYSMYDKLPQYSTRTWKYEYFNHLVVYSFASKEIYDVRGKVDLLDVANEYDANGYSVISKEDLKKKMGNNDKNPLYFDNELHLEIIKRLDLFFGI